MITIIIIIVIVIIITKQSIIMMALPHFIISHAVPYIPITRRYSY